MAGINHREPTICRQQYRQEAGSVKGRSLAGIGTPLSEHSTGLQMPHRLRGTVAVCPATVTTTTLESQLTAGVEEPSCSHARIHGGIVKLEIQPVFPRELPSHMPLVDYSFVLLMHVTCLIWLSFPSAYWTLVISKIMPCQVLFNCLGICAPPVSAPF